MTSKQFYNSSAWRWLAKYAKVWHSKDGLIVSCMTCNRGWLPITGSQTHAGHLIKFTDSKAVCLEFFNIGIQCNKCNIYQGGRQDKMREKLSIIHGKDKIDSLYIQKNNILKIDKFILDYHAKMYKYYFHELLKVRQLKNPWRQI